jgi:hypothetical protein
MSSLNKVMRRLLPPFSPENRRTGSFTFYAIVVPKAGRQAEIPSVLAAIFTARYCQPTAALMTSSLGLLGTAWAAMRSQEALQGATNIWR